MLGGLWVRASFWVGDWLCVASTRIVLFVHVVVWPGASCAACFLVCVDQSIPASLDMLFVYRGQGLNFVYTFRVVLVCDVAMW